MVVPTGRTTVPEELGKSNKGSCTAVRVGAQTVRKVLVSTTRFEHKGARSVHLQARPCVIYL